MINSKSFANLAAVLFVSCALAPVHSQTTDTISGRELLKMMRQQDANDRKGAYGQLQTRIASLQDRLLITMPADCLFCVRVNNLDYTLSQVDQFLAGASPMPMGASMLVRMQLAQMLGSPELNGIKTDGSFAIFGTVLPADPAKPAAVPNLFIAGLVPVTDYEFLISGNPNVAERDEKGVSKITAGQPAAIVQLGDFALISSVANSDRLVEMAKSRSLAKAAGLAGTLDAAEAQKAVEQPIWAYGDIQLASKTFGPLLFAQLEQLKTMMAPAGPAGKGPVGSPEKMINMYISILQTLMKETKFLSIAVNPKPNVLHITETISALPGTDMAAMFSTPATPAKENKLLGYLEDGVVVNFAGKMNTPLYKQINIKSMDLLAGVAGQTLTAEDTQKIKKLTEDSFAAIGTWMAGSFSIDAKSKPPFAMNYAIEVKDPDKFNKVITDAAALMNTGPIGNAYKSLGMETQYTINRRIATYKGVSIDSAKLVMKSTDPNSPEGQIIEKMYGGGIEYRWAIINGLCVGAVAADVDSQIRKLIDQVKAAGPKQIAAEPTAALALLPNANKADFFGTLNYLRVLEIIPLVTPLPMPPMNLPTKSNIAFACNAGNGKMTIDIALPKEHLTEIMNAFMMMQQQKMQMMQQTPQPTPTPGTPAAQQNLWTCPMHPQVLMPQQGKCPLCNMDLIRHAPPPKEAPPKQAP